MTLDGEGIFPVPCVCGFAERACRFGGHGGEDGGQFSFATVEDSRFFIADVLGGGALAADDGGSALGDGLNDREPGGLVPERRHDDGSGVLNLFLNLGVGKPSDAFGVGICFEDCGSFGAIADESARYAGGFGGTGEPDDAFLLRETTNVKENRFSLVVERRLIGGDRVVERCGRGLRGQVGGHDVAAKLADVDEMIKRLVDSLVGEASAARHLH